MYPCLTKSYLELPLSADARVSWAADSSVDYCLAGLNNFLNLGPSLIT